MAIGFFSPLPLAFMIPFMSAQSMAMGESFGKGFQYGKRKISSKTNEEFNAYSYQNMWDETTANIESMTPSLEQMLKTSLVFQEKIFVHMFELIPAFINAISKATIGIATNTTETTETSGNLLPEAFGSTYGRGGPDTGLGPDLGGAPYKDYSKNTGLPVDTSTIIKRVQTPDLSKYNNMTLIQLQNAIINSSGSLRSYLLNLQRKKAFPKQSTIVAPIIYKGTSVTTITFTYVNKLTSRATAKSRTQVYRFDYNGHMRKLRSIFKLHNTGRTAELPHRKASYMRMILSYSAQIKRAYPGKPVKI